MKKTYIIIYCLIFLQINFSAVSQKYNNNVKFQYLYGQKSGNVSKETLLYFSIRNDSNDTLYLSKNNILVTVNKNGKALKELDNKATGQFIFESDKKSKAFITAQNLQEKETKLLRNSFANKLYNKNFSYEKLKRDKEFVIDLIETKCIVILPYKTINYARIFVNSEFDKRCKVNAKYLSNNIFTYYMDVRDKKEIRIDIKS